MVKVKSKKFGANAPAVDTISNYYLDNCPVCEKLGNREAGWKWYPFEEHYDSFNMTCVNCNKFDIESLRFDISLNGEYCQTYRCIKKNNRPYKIEYYLRFYEKPNNLGRIQNFWSAPVITSYHSIPQSKEEFLELLEVTSVDSASLFL